MNTDRDEDGQVVIPTKSGNPGTWRLALLDDRMRGNDDTEVLIGVHLCSSVVAYS
jgi:hypothetical protein